MSMTTSHTVCIGCGRAGHAKATCPDRDRVQMMFPADELIQFLDDHAELNECSRLAHVFRAQEAERAGHDVEAADAWHWASWREGARDEARKLAEHLRGQIAR